jgi:hypothetical protein
MVVKIKKRVLKGSNHHYVVIPKKLIYSGVIDTEKEVVFIIEENVNGRKKNE